MRRLARILVGVAVVASLSVWTPGQALADFSFGTCDPANDGRTVIDPETQWVWRCTYGGDNWPEWIWLPLGDISWLKDEEFWGTQGSLAQGCVNALSGITNNIPTFGVLGGSSSVSSLWAGYDNDGKLCDYHRTQPPGELRVRGVTSRWNGSQWVLCVDTGYIYNGSTAWSIVASRTMGTVADCGSGYYRQETTGQIYDSGAWRVNSRTSPSRWMN